MSMIGKRKYEEANTKIISLEPLMIIKPALPQNIFNVYTEARIMEINKVHADYLNNNFDLLQKEKIKINLSENQDDHKGLFILHNFLKKSQTDEYNFHWMTLNDFQKKRIPEQYHKKMIKMIEECNELDMIIMFCDNESLSIIYKL